MTGTARRSASVPSTFPIATVSTTHLRNEFIALAEQDGNIREICRRFAISPLGYKWLPALLSVRGTQYIEHTPPPRRFHATTAYRRGHRQA